jgi:hypothetical protein
MIEPKDQPNEFEDVDMGELNDTPINIAHEVEETIEEWGVRAAEIAQANSRFFEMAGLDDKAADWAEVKRSIEERYTVRKEDATVKPV